MSKHKSITALFCLLTAALVSACDPTAAVFDSIGRPTAVCTDIGDGHCPRPPVTPPDDIKQS